MVTRPRLTIKDVAAAAGVSTQTVSRVLNNRPDVAPETYERVQQVIADTGYSPNMLARGLIQGRSQTLGVVAYGLEYFGPSRILTGIDQEAAETDYSITLNLLHDVSAGDVEGLLNALYSRRVDGIIWAIPEVGDNRLWSRTMGSDFPVPILLVGGMAGQSAFPTIAIDNLAIGRIATEHLLAGGARHIGLVTGPLDWWEAQERARGWRVALEASGIEPDERLVVEGDWSPDSGERALHRLVAQAPSLDAVFASNDQMALGILHAAHVLGRSVPDDLAVVGVDNIAEGSHFWPSLTTIHQPVRDAGAMAVRTIGALIGDDNGRPGPSTPAGVRSVLLEPKLIVRESSRPGPVGS